MTLVEVLLAMVILAIAAGVLMTATSRCLAVIRISRNYHTARNVFDRGELEYPILQKEGHTYNLELSPVSYDRGFAFSREAEEMEAHKGMYVVRTKVTWSEETRKGTEETVRFLYCTNSIE